jgi:hypothetical protein
MNNIKELKLKKINEIKKEEKNIKFWNFIYKIIGYIHAGFAGPVAVNAMKELFIGSVGGLGILIGLFASLFITCYPIKKKIENCMNKKSKLEIDLNAITKEENRIKLLKEMQKQNNNKKVNTQYMANDYFYTKDQEIKLTLRK